MGQILPTRLLATILLKVFRKEKLIVTESNTIIVQELVELDLIRLKNKRYKITVAGFRFIKEKGLLEPTPIPRDIRNINASVRTPLNMAIAYLYKSTVTSMNVEFGLVHVERFYLQQVDTFQNQQCLFTVVYWRLE